MPVICGLCNGLKAQKHLAQGNALGSLMGVKCALQGQKHY